MIELWRELLYPLGFVAQTTFGARMLWQWYQSEVRQESMVTPLFWQLSLLGNLLLMLHTTFQSQFHIFTIQTCCAVISWRNLNLMAPSEKHIRTGSTLLLLVLTLVTTTVGFIWLNGLDGWFRVPITPWNKNGNDLSLFWHLLGCVGLLIFSSRHWVQWIQAEKQMRSELGPIFWWTSLIGHTLLFAYYLRMRDVANLLGPIFAMAPYIRNLTFLYRQAKV